MVKEGKRWPRPGPAGPPGLRILLVLVFVVALLFALPWLPEPPPGGAALERYSPVHDGTSSLVETYGPEGKLLSTESQNIVVVPALKAFTQLPPGPRQAVNKAYGSPEEMEDVRVMELRRRSLNGSGEISESTDTLALEPRGLFLIGSREGVGEDAIFDSPVLLLPADLGPESRWDSEGRLGELDYGLSGRVLGSGSFEGKLGTFDDCLRVETTLTLSGSGQQDTRTTFRDLYCAGAGLVESREFDGSGALARKSVTVSTDRTPGTDEPRLGTADLTGSREPTEDPADWRLAHFGRARLSDEAYTRTIPATYVPTDPPVVLAAAQDRDLVALDAGEEPGTVRWRFNPEGTVYGPPAFDAASGRLYFGATDKRLYALDARGLFLWTFETGDNVASRPVVARDTVIFGSEDNNVYGLDARTGGERWKVETGGPVVSSPALAEGVAVIGSDDGAVYGLDPGTGERRWIYVSEGPVEAPIVAEDGVAYVASRSGELVALDARTGEEIWTSPPGDVLRTAPVVGEKKIFVVDDAYDLLAFDRRTGKRLWEVQGDTFYGPPLLAGGEVLVAGYDGNVYRFDPGGERRDRWEGAVASNPLDGNPKFSTGPTAGGGAVWMTADSAAVLRLGPTTGPAHLKPVWAVPFSVPPFSGDSPQYTAADYRGEALLLGAGGGVYLADAESGEVRKAGALEAGSGSHATEPVVADGTLLTVRGNTLHAAGLPDGKTLWRSEVEAEGRAVLRPPVVAGDRVLWIPAPKEGEPGVLKALDLTTGKPLWEAPLTGAGGGVIVRDGTAYTSPAAAFDLETGRPLWRAENGEGPATGGPALSESGDALFFGVADEGGSGSIVAVDPEDGDELWRRELDGETVSSADRLWAGDGSLVVPTLSGAVIGLDSETGEERWRYEPPFPRLGNVTLEDGRVWLALQNGEVLALDAGSGEVAARSNDYSLDLNVSSLAQRPVLVGENLVLGVGSYALGFQPSQEGER